MRKKGFYFLLTVLALSLITCALTVLTPHIAAAETAITSSIAAPDDNQAVRETKPIETLSTTTQNKNQVTSAVKVNPVSEQAILRQNNWGASSNKETVKIILSQSKTSLDWNWNRQDPLPYKGVSYIQPIYPNAGIYLKSPVTVGDIQSFNLFTDFNYTQPPNGSYNLSYDIFLRDKETKVPKVEIMIWFDWTRPQPSSSFKGSCSDGNNIYKKYWWTMADGCAYRSFLLDSTTGIAPNITNLKALIDEIQPDNDLYIDEISLGTEVWSGSGEVELTTYYFELNGIRY